MVQTFSIPSEVLSKFLGTVFLNADRVAVVSPWVSDITIRYPNSDRVSQREMLFSEAVTQLNVNVEMFVDPKQDHHNRQKHTSLLPKISGSVPISEVEDLHDKAVVTDQVLYQGSANITYNGLNVNIELCDIRENEYGDVDRFLKRRLGIGTE